ncbi:MAG: hypothetical protein ACRD8Z_26195, partial [Nitrososphaeraceae archaeon]
VARSIYTYTVQIPYLKIALQELEEYFELNNIPSTEQLSAVIQVDSGVTAIKFNAAGTATDPKLPNDLIEPQKLWERTRDVNPFIPMTKLDALPQDMLGTEISQFQIYVWEANEIRLLSANQNNDIKMEYIRNLFVLPAGKDSIINVINGKTFLEYRNAALCAEFVGENKTRADDLNSYAGLAIDRSTGIGTKGRQSVVMRRRPFRSSYKRRSFI